MGLKTVGGVVIRAKHRVTCHCGAVDCSWIYRMAWSTRGVATVHIADVEAPLWRPCH